MTFVYLILDTRYTYMIHVRFILYLFDVVMRCSISLKQKKTTAKDEGQRGPDPGQSSLYRLVENDGAR